MTNNLINRITTTGFNPDSLIIQEDDSLEVAKQKQIDLDALAAVDIEALKLVLPDLGCLVGCVVQYVLCMAQGHPGNLICQGQYNSCQQGCQGITV